MRKEVSLILKDDVTELNKRLKEGYTVNQNMQLAEGMLIILTKYVAETSSTPSAIVEGQLSVAGLYGTSPTRNY
jgi:dynactin complex subunit